MLSFSTYEQNKVPLFFDERGIVKRHIVGLTSIYSSVNILFGMNELRFASVLHTFDASSCEASLNTIENINSNEKSLMPAGKEANINPNICVHTIGRSRDK